eukprot:NODE_296_length_11478_cov_0.345197.p9 type:complete len:149 gc:universal NODE_296_length_11478_cov_0.345197:2780-3226(+)
MAREIQPKIPSVNITIDGEVVRGFGRGSKELGIPTANLDQKSAAKLEDSLETGIYYGYGYLRNARYPMVMSYGWNPFYKNTVRSCEVHLIQELNDFYGENLKITILGYIRPELDYTGVEDLIRDIKIDIATAKEMTNKPEYLQFALGK